MKREGKVLTYSEFYKKHFGKWSAHDILFGWFDYCEGCGIKDTYNADEEVRKLNRKFGSQSPIPDGGSVRD